MVKDINVIIAIYGDKHGAPPYHQDNIQTEITRCADCIWYECESNGKTFCSHPKGLLGWVRPTDFCCRAKRRTVSKEGD